MKEKAIIFIDGNNFYNRMKEMKLPSGAEFDYIKFSQKLVGHHAREETRYYVGQIKRGDDESGYFEQRDFLRFLEKLERVSCHTGRVEKYEKRDTALHKWLKSLDERPDIKIPQNTVEELRSIAIADSIGHVEKEVDEMISVDMVSMAYCGDYDVAYLVSADGDFVPAVEKVREIGKKVIVASIRKGYALEQAADAFIPLKRDFFDGMMD